MATQNSSGLVSTVYKSRKTVIELMKAQGYAVEEYANFSVNEVNSMLQHKQLDMLMEKLEEDPSTKRKNKIYIRYYLTKTLRPQNIQEILDDLFHLEEILTKQDTLMIIIKDDMNETMTNLLKHIWEQDSIFIVIQNIKRLQFNILEHAIVPPHRVLTKDEVVEIKNKYNIIDDFQFPDVSRFDPVSQVIGIRPGQVCEIIRPSKTAIQSYYYRICI